MVTASNGSIINGQQILKWKC